MSQNAETTGRLLSLIILLHFQPGGIFDLASKTFGGDNYDNEVTRLATENTELIGKLESQEKMMKKLKRQLKIYNKKLNAPDRKWIFFDFTKKIKCEYGFGRSGDIKQPKKCP